MTLISIVIYASRSKRLHAYLGAVIQQLSEGGDVLPYGGGSGVTSAPPAGYIKHSAEGLQQHRWTVRTNTCTFVIALL